MVYVFTISPHTFVLGKNTIIWSSFMADNQSLREQEYGVKHHDCCTFRVGMYINN